jgi:hypothetical protein
MKTILAGILIIFPMSIFAADDIKIPFITNVNTLNENISKSAQIYEKSPPWSTNSTVKNIDGNKIANTIRDVKTTVCSAVESGSVKVYFTLDVEGKILGIGASSGAGIEVTFNCEKSKSY